MATNISRYVINTKDSEGLLLSLPQAQQMVAAERVEVEQWLDVCRPHPDLFKHIVAEAEADLRVIAEAEGILTTLRGYQQQKALVPMTVYVQ